MPCWTSWSPAERSQRSLRQARASSREHRIVEASGLLLAPAFVDPHVHLRTPGREDEEDIVSGTEAAAAGGYCAILAMPNTEPVVDSASVLRSLTELAQRDARVPGWVSCCDHEGAGGLGADRDGRACRGGRRRVQRRRQAGDLGPGASSCTSVQRGLGGAHRASRGGPRPLSRWTDARGSRLRRARSRRLALRGGVDDGRARPCARRLREPSTPPSAPLGTRIGRRAAPGACGRRAGLRRGHAASSLSHRRVGPSARHELQDESATRVRGRPKGADRGAPRRNDPCRGDRSRPARSPREGGALRGGSFRGDRSRDRVRRALYKARSARGALARDTARADERGARVRLRARATSDCGRRSGESRSARPRAGLESGRAALPLEVAELVASRSNS